MSDMGERCDFTDLHVIACAHCQKHPDAQDHLDNPNYAPYAKPDGRPYGPAV